MPMTDKQKQRRQEIESRRDQTMKEKVISRKQFQTKLKESRLTIRFPYSDVELLDNACERMGLGRSGLIRMVVKEWIENNQEKVKPYDPFGRVVQSEVAVAHDKR